MWKQAGLVTQFVSKHDKQSLAPFALAFLLDGRYAQYQNATVSQRPIILTIQDLLMLCGYALPIIDKHMRLSACRHLWSVMDDAERIHGMGYCVSEFISALLD